jgi:hypothetical protein
VPAPDSRRRRIISTFLARPDVLRLLLTALGALIVLWQRLLVPVLLGLLVYAWSCLLADRLSQRFGRSRAVAAFSGAVVGTLVFAAFAGLVTWTVALASADEVAVLARLCAAAAVPTDTANRLVEGLRAAWARDAEGADSAGRAPLAVQRFEHLAWLGLDASVLTALRPLLDVLPLRTQVNVNSAPLEVLAAVLGVDAGTAQRLLVRRQTAPFDHLDGLRTLLPDGVAFEPARLSVRSSYFEARGRVRLETRMVEERALLQRRGTGEVVVVRRTRESLPAGAP